MAIDGTWCVAPSTPGSIRPSRRTSRRSRRCVGGGLWTMVAARVVSQPVPPDWPGYLIEVVPVAAGRRGRPARRRRSGSRSERPTRRSGDRTALAIVAALVGYGRVDRGAGRDARRRGRPRAAVGDPDGRRWSATVGDRASSSGRRDESARVAGARSRPVAMLIPWAGRAGSSSGRAGRRSGWSSLRFDARRDDCVRRDAASPRAIGSRRPSAAGRTAAQPGLGHRRRVEQPVELGGVHAALERQLADRPPGLEAPPWPASPPRRSRSPGRARSRASAPARRAAGPRSVAVRPSIAPGAEVARGRGQQRRSIRAARPRSPAASR